MKKQKLDELRRRPEESLNAASPDLSGKSGDELRTALQELQIYQTELELQNEELHRVQDELVEARDKWVDLYDFAPVGYLTLSDKNLIEDANLTVAELLGEERRSLIGQPFSRFIFDEDQDIFYTCFRDLVASTNRLPCDLRLLRRNGYWFWAKLECVSRSNSETNCMHIRIALHDNTQTKYLEAEIIKAKKMEATAKLAGGIAHDFNNLLAIILGNIDLAEEDMLQGRPVAQKIQYARKACLCAADLTKQFVTFASGCDPVTKLTSVKPLILYSVRPVLAGSNVDLQCSFPEGLWVVKADISQIALAIGNVITNSKEAMPQGGVIRIEVENVDTVPGQSSNALSGQDAKYVKIAIRDQGVGIPGNILPQVFDPYFTSKGVKHVKGLGLGLTVTYSIVKKHGGFTEIVSQPDTGTTVTIYLPASERQIVPHRPALPAVIPISRKILVMDDEEMLRNVVCDMLERLGYEVEVAANGEEAIQLYTRAKKTGQPFGTVILDLTVKGGMGGKETLRRLKEFDPEVRAIVASGYSVDQILANFKQHGFLAVLQKPYQQRDLDKILDAQG